MDEIATKAIIIGVSIFVTIIIFTFVLFEFFQMRQLYKNVGETNVSFESQFNELDKFNDSNNVFTGLDVRNYIKKYENDKSIQVCIGDKCSDIIISEGEYADPYTAELSQNNNGYRIVFSKKT